MSAPTDRHARQAEALRANLARRKAQSRARADEPLPSPGDSSADPTDADKSAPPPE